MYQGPRFSAGTGYPIGINTQFNNNQNGSATFPMDWNYLYGNRLPRFDIPMTNAVNIGGLPMNDAVTSAVASSTITVPNTISSPADLNVNNKCQLEGK